MAVSKTLRYQVLRRDNFTCRYCGGVAPDVILTVDHVLPVALGGSDDPSNLVVACRDCNAGKAAANPDQPLLDQVSEDAVRWADAVKVAAAQVLQRHRDVLAARETFDSMWGEFTYQDRSGTRVVPRPHGWEGSLDNMRVRGLSDELLQECIRIAMSRPGITLEGRFKYFCGVAWSKIRAIEEIAKIRYDGAGRTERGEESVIPGSQLDDDQIWALLAVMLADILVGRVIEVMDGTEEDQRCAYEALRLGLTAASNVYRRRLRAGHSRDDVIDAAVEEFQAEINREIYRIGDNRGGAA